MKHTLIALAAALLVCTTATHAQTETDTTPAQPNRWSVGIVGGYGENTPVITMPDYASTITYQKGNGFTVGLTGRYDLKRWLTARADLILIQKNYTMNRTGFTASNIINSEYTNNYLLLPLRAQINIGHPFSIHAFAGGYVGYWLGGHRTGSSFSWDYCLYGSTKYIAYDEDWEFDTERDNRFDAGITFGGGCGYTIARRFEIIAEAAIYYGLTDVQKDYMRSQRHHYNTTMAIQLGAVYHF